MQCVLYGPNRHIHRADWGRQRWWTTGIYSYRPIDVRGRSACACNASCCNVAGALQLSYDQSASLPCFRVPTVQIVHTLAVCSASPDLPSVCRRNNIDRYSQKRAWQIPPTDWRMIKNKKKHAHMQTHRPTADWRLTY